MIASLCLVLGSDGLGLLMISRARHEINRTDLPFIQRQELFLKAARIQWRVAHVTRWTLRSGIVGVVAALGGVLVLRRRLPRNEN